MSTREDREHYARVERIADDQQDREDAETRANADSWAQWNTDRIKAKAQELHDDPDEGCGCNLTLATPRDDDPFKRWYQLGWHEAAAEVLAEQDGVVLP